MLRKETLRQPTPGPSGTQWSEELFREPSQTKEPPIPDPSPSSKPPEDFPTWEPEPEVAPMQSKEEPFGKQLLHFFNSSQLFLPFSLTISSLSRHYLLGNYYQQYAHWVPPPPSSYPTPPPSPPVPPPSTPTPVPSPDLPPIAAKNPTACSPPVPRSSHFYNDTCQEFTDLQPTLMIP
ncbi:hypothetical protein O181_088006 [Austropuccinia psidii MF-1]|uniref:Uncharacterized protein n=1 Tax=Austropuccinia psidii MF-1 TaxID=1389203 RepID=A0A9Q3IQQ5_9BASI|nr:hypothetical protein [Austropuccinia psidii MF-1]